MAHEREPGERAARAIELLDSFVARVRRTDVDSSGLLEPATTEVFHAFAAAGVDALLLKGAALAALLYKPGEHRPYVDVDLLIRPSHRAEAEQTLSGLGYHNASEPLGIEDVGRVVHADTWLGVPTGGDQQVVVELHHWLPGAQAPPADAWDALWRRRTAIELNGSAIPVLDREGQALQLATHAAQHGPGFVKGLTELTLALERWPADVWRRSAELAAEIGATDSLGAGLRLVSEGEAMAVALELSPDPALEWEVRHRGEQPRGGFHVEAFRDATSLRGRLRLVRRALLPNRRWLTTEYRWAERGGALLPAAYALHVLRAPLWAARAWRFRHRAKRGA